MRNLFLLRGCPASGKSSWVTANMLEPWTVSTDSIRLFMQSPSTNVSGDLYISQANNKNVFKFLFEVIEGKMKRGEFIIVDATHADKASINSYKQLVDKYRYRLNIVDFSEIPLEECLKRNQQREGYKFVPEEVITRMWYACEDKTVLKKAYKLLTPSEALSIIKSDLAPVKCECEKVVIFGDIHGCYTPLKTYFEKNPFNDNYCYIFTGDYLDRGLQNKEVLEFLLSIYNKPNVFLIEGNHEKWLRLYANGTTLPKTDKRDFDILLYSILETLRAKHAWCEEELSKQKQKLVEVDKLISNAVVGVEGDCTIYYDFRKENGTKLLAQIEQAISELKQGMEFLKKNIYIIEHEALSIATTISLLGQSYERIFKENLPIVFTNKVLSKVSLEKKDTACEIKSSEFLNKTLPQIRELPIKEIQQLCRKLIQMSYFEFKGQKYLVTHGGLVNYPSILTPTSEMITGIGEYNDQECVDTNFSKNCPDVIQIHGHRNINKVPVAFIPNRAYNLEQGVEHGGNLAILEISEGVDVVEIPNTDYVLQQEINSEINTLRDMAHSPLIITKHLKDDICSFNFSREAFYNSAWNNLTCKARGLFVDKTNGNIVARSYDKFFNINELKSTKVENLEKTLAFPVMGYKKENGFLGIVSKYKGQIRFFTKSSDEGDYVNWFIGALCENYQILTQPNTRTASLIRYTDIYNKMLQIFLEEDKIPFKAKLTELKNQLMTKLDSNIKEGYSYVFECIDPINDPHIIEYDKSQVYLLEVFKNSMVEEKCSYEELLQIGKHANIAVKERAFVLSDKDAFMAWVKAFENSAEEIEGYVLEDANAFRVKFKTPYYKFWKSMRNLKEALKYKGEASYNKSHSKETALYNFLKSDNKNLDLSIIDCRRALETISNEVSIIKS